ncbi:MAG TPA: LysR family transcriptional regulator [Candidatus Dormibacteraeota bacterium]|nr:LysR family transcriptional regulator [Candidatus Dormibacteraeota bacterium]
MAELRHYRYFVEIARRRTFTAAAEALNMTQSALSEQILQLERECGSLLFNRHHNGITLTPAGEYLLDRAQALLGSEAEMRDGLAGFRHGYQDRLRVASILGPLQSWLPAALVEFVRAEPQVQLQVNHHHGVNEILAAVAADQVDVGVVSLRPTSPARSRHHELSQVVLMDEELVVVVPAGHSLAALADVRRRDLGTAHLVTFPSNYNVRRVIDDWYREAGLTPTVAVETGAIEVMLRLIASGVGIAVLPRSLAWRGLAAGLRSVPIAPSEAPPRRVVAAVHRIDGRHAELARGLVSVMEVHAADAGRVATLSGAGVPATGLEAGR